MSDENTKKKIRVEFTTDGSELRGHMGATVSRYLLCLAYDIGDLDLLDSGKWPIGHNDDVTKVIGSLSVEAADE